MTHHPFCQPPATSEDAWRCVRTCLHDREEYVKGLEDRLVTCEAALAAAKDSAKATSVALQRLVTAAEVVGRVQPASYSRTQSEADGWAYFYDAIYAANKILFGLEDA